MPSTTRVDLACQPTPDLAMDYLCQFRKWSYHHLSMCLLSVGTPNSPLDGQNSILTCVYYQCMIMCSTFKGFSRRLAAVSERLNGCIHACMAALPPALQNLDLQFTDFKTQSFVVFHSVMFLLSSLEFIRLMTLPQSNLAPYLISIPTPLPWELIIGDVLPQGSICLGMRTFQKDYGCLFLLDSLRVLFCLDCFL